MTDNNIMGGAVAANDQKPHGSGDGVRRIDLAFVRSGDVVELIVMGAPADVVVRHAYWDYDAQNISGMYNRDIGADEQQTFIAKAIEVVQGWDANGGMQRLKDMRRIRDLENQLAEKNGTAGR
jgi:hypothetical protein